MSLVRLSLVLGAVFLLEAVALWLLGIERLNGLLFRVCASAGLPFNTVIVLLGAGALGTAAGVVGSFAVLRRRALVGDAAAHAAFPGLCGAFLLLHERNFALLLLGGMLSALAGVAFLSWLQKNTRTKADAAMGLTLSSLFGLGIVLSRIIQDDPSGRQAGLDAFLLGKTAGMVTQDLMIILIVGVHVIGLAALLYKEFLLVSFDPDFGSAQGWPVLALDLLLLGLIVVTTIIGLPAVGVVLMAAMLILPGVSARFWTERLGAMLWLAAAFGLVIGMAGVGLSAQFQRFPAGPLIILTGATLFLFSMLFAPRRGVLARWWQVHRTNRRIARQNLLRALYELSESRLAERPPVPFDGLLLRRSWSRQQVARLLHAARAAGEVEAAGGGWRLTERGLAAGAQTVRAHRLWELYLVHQAHIQADHVDRDADEAEHLLSPDVVQQLEQLLAQTGQLPRDLPPASIHPLGANAHAGSEG
jgi:manganese/zinc/iron transport system permease protein